MRSKLIARLARLSAGVALVLVACLPADGGPNRRVFDVRIKDFKISPSSASAPGGDTM